MPATNDYLSALNQQHPDINLMGNNTLTDYANSASGSGMSTGDFVNKYNSDPSIFQAYNQKYQTMAQPQLSSLDAQIGQQGTQMGLADQSTANSGNTLNNDAANAEKNMRVQGMSQGDNIANAADHAGLGNAGTTLVSQANNNQDVTRNISYTEANRANSLAQLSLQNASTKAGIQGNIDNLQGQKGAINYNTAQAAQGNYNQDSATMFDRNNQLFNDSLALPAGRSVNIGPGYTVQGSKSDPSGFTSALQGLLPLLNQAGGKQVLSGFLPALAQQFGVPINGDLLSSIKSYAANPATSNGGGGNTGGGNTGGGSSNTGGGSGNIGGSSSKSSTATTGANSGSVSGPGRSGTPLAEENVVTPWLSQYFKSSSYQPGQDNKDLASIANKFGISHQQASYLFYTTRKAVLHN